MKYVTGVEPSAATHEDFQRIFKCQNLRAVDCNDKGLQFPATCSVPPCNECIAKRIGDL